MKEGVQVRDSVNVIQVVICLQLCVQRLEQAHKGTLQLLDGAQVSMLVVSVTSDVREGWQWKQQTCSGISTLKRAEETHRFKRSSESTLWISPLTQFTPFDIIMVAAYESCCALPKLQLATMRG